MRCELLVEREPRCRRAKSARSHELRAEFTPLQPGALSTDQRTWLAACVRRRAELTGCGGPALILSIATLVCAAPARADEVGCDWPLRPPPAVVRGFDAPSPNWNPGHRGVDLAGTPGQPVYAAGAATVVFAGTLAGRPVVSLAHPGWSAHQLRAGPGGVRVGQPVTAADGDRRIAGRPPRLSGPRHACTGARCGVRRRAPTTSIRWAC